MKILHTVEFYEPFKGGAQEVVKQLSNRMVKAGHDVTVATTKLTDRKHKTINGVKIVEFELSGNAVHGYKGDVEVYKKFLRDSKYDVIMNYAAQQWATDLFFEVIDEISAKKVLVPCGFSGLYEQIYKDYFKHLPEILKKYDASVYLSSDYRDINFAKKNKIKNTIIIPNGAGEDEFFGKPKLDMRSKLGIGKHQFLVMTLGTHTGVKGHHETIEIFKKANIVDSVLVIVGNGLDSGCGSACLTSANSYKYNLLARIKQRKILVVDPPREEAVDIFKAADLFLFPSNIEASPIVLFEACASKTPFLTSEVGNSREIIKWTSGGRLLPTTKDSKGFSKVDVSKSAIILKQLVAQPGELKKMGEKGYLAWREKYTWEKITEQYLALYKELINK